MEYRPRDKHTTHEIAAREIAVLERAATGLEHATGAERVYCAVLAESGVLSFRAAAPAGSGAPGDLSVDDLPGIDAALSGVVVPTDCLPGPFAGPGTCLAVPFIARGAVLGVALLVMAEKTTVPDASMLALLGETIGDALASLRDCDRLVGLMTEMRENANVLDALIEAISDPVKLMDLDGCILRWNKSAEQLYGWTEPEVLGERMPQIPEDARIRAMRDIRHIAAGERPVEREVLHRDKDGRQFQVALTIVPVADGEGHPSGVLSVVREAIPYARTAAADSEMSTVMARTLKSSLTALAGYAQLLAREEILQDPARRTRTISALEDRAGVISELIDAVLLISRLEDADFAAAVEQVDMAGLVTDAVGTFEQAGPGHVVIDYEPGLDSVQAEPRLLLRAVLTFLRAAAEGAKGTGVTLSVTSAPAGVIVTIRADADAARVNSQARHLEDDGAAEGEGAEDPIPRLEAHLARRIVEAHGGGVVVSAEKGEVVYRMRLPVGA